MMGKRSRSKRRKSALKQEKEASTESSPSLSVTSEGCDELEIPCALPENVFESSRRQLRHDDEDNDDDKGFGFLQKGWAQLERKRKTSWTPTPIQLQSWPILLHSTATPLLGIAPTGSGKTLSYGLPLLCHVAVSESSGICGLVLVPTRELALQVEKDLKVVQGAFAPPVIKVISVYGGVDRAQQVQALVAASVDHPVVVTATPGRLVDLLRERRNNNTESLSSSKNSSLLTTGLMMLVMDEADRLATHSDMSQQVDEVLELLLGKNSHKRSLTRIAMFSATFPEKAKNKWNEWMGNRRIVVRINTMTVAANMNDTKNKGNDDDDNNNKEDSAKGVAPSSSADHHLHQKDLKLSQDTSKDAKKKEGLNLAKIPAHLTQTLHVCANHKKPRKLVTTLKKVYKDSKQKRNKPLTLIFFARIKTLQYIVRMLQKEDDSSISCCCAELHSRLPQPKREKVLLNFKCGKVPILLATDVAARGLHVSNLSCVINYDFPNSLEQYVHRCGRAGRSGQEAVVYSFFHRELAPMAASVISLLRETNACVDPNLLELADVNNDKNKNNKSETRSSKKRKRPCHNINDPIVNPNVPADFDDDDDFDNGHFTGLNPKRIVLQRASHVSDASDSDSDSPST